jgi:hypothetical protein
LADNSDETALPSVTIRFSSTDSRLFMVAALPVAGRTATDTARMNTR